MQIPHTNYVIDSKGQKKYVQLSVEDWDLLISEIQRLENLVKFKSNLKEAFREVKEIKTNKKTAKTLSELIDEM